MAGTAASGEARRDGARNRRRPALGLLTVRAVQEARCRRPGWALIVPVRGVRERPRPPYGGVPERSAAVRGVDSGPKDLSHNAPRSPRPARRRLCPPRARVVQRTAGRAGRVAGGERRVPVSRPDAQRRPARPRRRRVRGLRRPRGGGAVRGGAPLAPGVPRPCGAGRRRVDPAPPGARGNVGGPSRRRPLAQPRRVRPGRDRGGRRGAARRAPPPARPRDRRRARGPRPARPAPPRARRDGQPRRRLRRDPGRPPDHVRQPALPRRHRVRARGGARPELPVPPDARRRDARRRPGRRPPAPPERSRRARPSTSSSATTRGRGGCSGTTCS